MPSPKCASCGTGFGLAVLTNGIDHLCANCAVREVELLRPEREKLKQIRAKCLEIDKDITITGKWRGSLEWVTSAIMCIAKYGEGYDNCRSRENLIAEIVVIRDGVC